MVFYIRDIFDVIGDRNCGYRVVAHQIYGTQDAWVRVRKECFWELTRRKQLYASLFGVSDVDEYLDNISYYNDDGDVAPLRHWM